MNFADPDFLRDHIKTTMQFYHPRCVDRGQGGFFQYFRDDGTIYDSSSRHLVSSARFVFNYAMASIYFDEPEYKQLTEHGLKHLRQAHWQPDTEGYAWTLKNGQADDRTNHCYGLAFVLLAYACAVKAGMNSARESLYQTLPSHCET